MWSYRDKTWLQMSQTYRDSYLCGAYRSPALACACFTLRSAASIHTSSRCPVIHAQILLPSDKQRVCACGSFHVWACLFPACYWRHWNLVMELSGKTHQHLNTHPASHPQRLLHPSGLEQDTWRITTKTTATAKNNMIKSVHISSSDQQTVTLPQLPNQPPHLKAKSHLSLSYLTPHHTHTHTQLFTIIILSIYVIHPSNPHNVPHFSLANACKQPWHTLPPPTPPVSSISAIYPACRPQNQLSRLPNIRTHTHRPLHKNTHSHQYMHMQHKHPGNTPAPSLTLRNAGTSWWRK